MTHAELVRKTAEKMVEVNSNRFNKEQLVWILGETTYNKQVQAFIPLAILAVEMKAEGFDEGYLCRTQSEGFNFTERREYRITRFNELGLTKPTQNEQ